MRALRFAWKKEKRKGEGQGNVRRNDRTVSPLPSPLRQFPVFTCIRAGERFFRPLGRKVQEPRATKRGEFRIRDRVGSRGQSSRRATHKLFKCFSMCKCSHVPENHETLSHSPVFRQHSTFPRFSSSLSRHLPIPLSRSLSRSVETPWILEGVSFFSPERSRDYYRYRYLTNYRSLLFTLPSLACAFRARRPVGSGYSIVLDCISYECFFNMEEQGRLYTRLHDFFAIAIS